MEGVWLQWYSWLRLLHLHPFLGYVGLAPWHKSTRVSFCHSQLRMNSTGRQEQQWEHEKTEGWVIVSQKGFHQLMYLNWASGAWVWECSPHFPLSFTCLENHWQYWLVQAQWWTCFSMAKTARAWKHSIVLPTISSLSRMNSHAPFLLVLTMLKLYISTGLIYLQLSLLAVVKCSPT